MPNFIGQTELRQSSSVGPLPNIRDEIAPFPTVRIVKERETLLSVPETEVNENMTFQSAVVFDETEDSVRRTSRDFPLKYATRDLAGH